MAKRDLFNSAYSEELYVRWLSGESLRAIAASLPPDKSMSHNSVKRLFAARYGSHATNPKETSLARSILADYGTKPEIVAWALRQVAEPDEYYHRSQHSIKQLTLFQVQQNEAVLEIESSRALQYSQELPDLHLTLFSYFADTLTYLLSACIKNTSYDQHRLALQERLCRAIANTPTPVPSAA
jgi:hypothetical protein